MAHIHNLSHGNPLPCLQLPQRLKPAVAGFHAVRSCSGYIAAYVDVEERCSESCDWAPWHSCNLSTLTLTHRKPQPVCTPLGMKTECKERLSAMACSDPRQASFCMQLHKPRHQAPSELCMSLQMLWDDSCPLGHALCTFVSLAHCSHPCPVPFPPQLSVGSEL